MPVISRYPIASEQLMNIVSCSSHTEERLALGDVEGVQMDFLAPSSMCVKVEILQTADNQRQSERRRCWKGNDDEEEAIKQKTAEEGNEDSLEDFSP